MVIVSELMYGQIDNGRWYVRPISWCGSWNQEGKLDSSYNVLAELDTEEECVNFIKDYDKCHSCYEGDLFKFTTTTTNN